MSRLRRLSRARKNNRLRYDSKDRSWKCTLERWLSPQDPGSIHRPIHEGQDAIARNKGPYCENCQLPVVSPNDAHLLYTLAPICNRSTVNIRTHLSKRTTAKIHFRTKANGFWCRRCFAIGTCRCQGWRASLRRVQWVSFAVCDRNYPQS